MQCQLIASVAGWVALVMFRAEHALAALGEGDTLHAGRDGAGDPAAAQRRGAADRELLRDRVSGPGGVAGALHRDDREVVPAPWGRV